MYTSAQYLYFSIIQISACAFAYFQYFSIIFIEIEYRIMWNESIDKDKKQGSNMFWRIWLAFTCSTLRRGWCVMLRATRMCAIYISKSNFIRRALCIHWNRIWNVYIWLDRFFIWCCAELWRRRNKNEKFKNIMVMVDIWVILEMPVIYRSSERVCIWMILFDFFS